MSRIATRDRQGLAETGLVLGLFAALGPLFIRIPIILSVGLAILAIVLGIRGGGFSSLGGGAIVLGGYVLVSLLVGGLWLASGVRGFDDPVPVPPGYGLRQPENGRGDVQHSYISDPVANPSEGRRVARRLIQDYTTALMQSGWEIETIGLDVVLARDPGSGDAVRASAYVVEPKPGTIAVQLAVGPVDCDHTTAC